MQCEEFQNKFLVSEPVFFIGGDSDEENHRQYQLVNLFLTIAPFVNLGFDWNPGFIVQFVKFRRRNPLAIALNKDSNPSFGVSLVSACHIGKRFASIYQRFDASRSHNTKSTNLRCILRYRQTPVTTQRRFAPMGRYESSHLSHSLNLPIFRIR